MLKPKPHQREDEIMDIYQQLEKAVLPGMTDSQTDLTKHDRKTIDANPGVPFIHYAGDTGTGIIMMIPASSYPREFERVPFHNRYTFATADRSYILNQAMCTAQYFDIERYYAKTVRYFDGSKLRQITHMDAINIVKTYSDKIRRQWAKEIGTNKH
jgi:hypothetical protein